MKLPFPVSWQAVSAIAWSSERLVRVKGAGPRGRLSTAERWLPDLQADLDRIHARAREAYGYRRREMQVESDAEGWAKLVTPDFEYVVTVGLDTDDDSLARWRREAVCRGGQAVDARLIEVFGDELDSVEYRFDRPIAIADIVDKIEEGETAGIRLDYDSLCTWCEVAIPGVQASLRLEPRRLVIRPVAGSGFSLREILRAF
jgi:hypothetical protein